MPITSGVNGVGMNLILKSHFYSINDLDVHLFKGYIPIIRRLNVNDDALDACKYLWEGMDIPDIEPAQWIKVKVIQTMLIDVDIGVIRWSIDKVNKGNIDQSTPVEIVTSSLNNCQNESSKCLLDTQTLMKMCKNQLDKHKTNGITDEELCIELINIMHCELLPAIQLNTNSLSALKDILTQYNLYIIDIEKTIETKTKSRSAYGIRLNTQRQKLINRFSKSVDTKHAFCSQFGKIFLGHILELVSIVSKKQSFRNSISSVFPENQYSKMMDQLKTVTIHQVSEDIDMSAKNMDLHTLTTAANNIVKKINKEKSITAGIKRSLMRTKSLDPHQTLYVSLAKSHRKITIEIKTSINIQISLKQVKAYVEEMIKNLAQNIAAETTLRSRKGSSRCTDIINRKVALRWQRPGELVCNLLDNPDGDLSKMHKQFFYQIIKQCDEYINKSMQETLLRRGKQLRVVELMESNIESLQKQIKEHISKIIGEIKYIARPKILSEKTIWIKYEPYLFEPLLIKVCELYKISRRKEMNAIESITRSQYNRMRSQMERQFAYNASFPSDSSDYNYDDNSYGALSIMVDDAAEILKNADLRLSSASSTCSSAYSDERRSDLRCSKTFDVVDEFQELSLTDRMTLAEMDSGTESDSDDDYDNVMFARVNWNEEVKKILDITVPNCLLKGLNGILQNISTLDRSLSTNKLTEYLITMILEIDPEVRMNLYSRILFLADYLPYFHNNNEYNFSLTTFHGSFTTLLDYKNEH